MLFSGKDLAKWTGGYWIDEVPSVIEGLFFDTREIEPKSLFIALSYGVRDGHDFVEHAINKELLACMVEKILSVDIPQLIVKDSLQALVAIAKNVRNYFHKPSNWNYWKLGKTSTKDMLKNVLGGEQIHATKGNWNNILGVSMTLAELDSDRYAFSIIEAGISERGEMSVLSSIIRPNICLFTSVGEAHLEGFGTVNIIVEEKSKLLESTDQGILIVAPKAVLTHLGF